LNVRDFALGDEPALQAVFHSAVHLLAVRDYTASQVAAWAPDSPDMERWTARMRALRPFVGEDDGRIVGYADLQPSGYIDHFYVAGHDARRIHARADEWKLESLFSDVSLTAQPFLEGFGFVVLEHKAVVVVGTVDLPNARMVKDLR
jgi:putative acetyltransferase